MNLETFRLKYPEFRTASSAFVQSFLDDAATYLSRDVLGDQYDHAHGLKAAHLIATSPGGVMARMVAKDGTTTYSKAYETAIQYPGVMVV
jgi:hypothetical protein